ncbi:MAG: UvrD-helicase domain-containing protein, partial [Clostridia bacterium]|nr:UvrD-helicase domain-containing protein [Clostridia bacterium]
MTDFDERYCALRRAVIEREFEKLNDRQKDGVFKTEGPVLILAGAGSGKTTVLINRIINLLRYGRGYESEEAPSFAGDRELDTLASYLGGDDVPDGEILRLCAEDPPKPYEIIAITFTNKAAAELRSRLELACGDEGRDIWAHTFHSACTRILRSHIERIGYKTPFTIYDEDDKKKAIAAVFTELGISERGLEPKFAAREISRAKDNLITPEEYAASVGRDPVRQAAAQVYERYSGFLRAQNALDFDDIIVKTVELFNTCPDVLEYYQRKFRYVLVDEYQDTNHAQYVLCSLLSGGYRNLCVVGDDDQSIYKFRGATVTNILEFEDEYKDAYTIRLEQNYRSTASILSAANGVIANNQNRKGKTLWTDKGDGEPVTLYTGNTQEDEAEFICRTVQEGVYGGGHYSDYCVLYRNHALSNSIESGLKRNGIPYRIVSGLRFFDRAEVKDMLAYLSVVNNTADSIRLGRIINVPARGIGATTQERVASIAFEENISQFEVMKNAEKYPQLGKAYVKLKPFTDMIESFIEAKDKGLMDLYDRILSETGYEDMLKALPRVEGEVKLDNVLELKSNIAEYEERAEEPTLNGFLEEISLFTDIDRYDENADAVTLMTIHSAKGL